MEHLFVTGGFDNRGGQVVLTNLVRGLTGEGVDAKLVGFKPEGTEDFPNCEPLYRDLNTTAIEIPAHDDKPSQTEERVKAAVNFLQTEHKKYDRIILDSWHVALAGITAQLDPSRTFQLVQSDPLYTPRDGSGFYETELLSLLPRFPMQRIMVSRYEQKLFEDRYGQQHPKIDLYIDQAFRSTEFTVEDRPTTRFVSSAADFTLPVKGLSFLLESLNKLEGDPFTLTLVSGKPIPAELLEGYSFPIDVTFASTPGHMAQVLSEHDVYVNASTRENFCLALAEAVTLGMPAVALDSGGNREYARGDNFILVEDTADFILGLEQVREIDCRQKLHIAARPSMVAYSSLERMVRQFRDITGI